MRIFIYLGTLNNAMRDPPILIVPKHVPLNVRSAPFVAVMFQPDPFVTRNPLEAFVIFIAAFAIMNSTSFYKGSICSSELVCLRSKNWRRCGY
jgi:hypothetical protein